MHKPWRLYARRLAGMSWDEIRTRGMQAAVKRWDLVRYRLGVPPAPPDGALAAAAAARFYFEPEDVPALAGILRRRFPREVGRILRQAEQICAHRFDLLGYEGLDYGPEIDWRLDAVHGKRAPRIPWYRIRYLDFNQVGDHKVIWELNRHQHLVTLAKAYRLSGETKFVEELLAQWNHWQRENPYPIGVNWASALEVAFRSLSWLWVRRLLEGCAAVPEEFPRRLRGALAMHARYIERYLSTYFAPNTHLLGEAVALFCIGLLCPELPAASRWRRRGWEIVLQQAERQVRADGLHFEQSTYYHVYALDFFLHARILAARNHISIPVSFDRTLGSMLRVLEALSQAGALPRFGDDDGGRLFDPRRNRPEHMTDPLATGAALYGVAEFRAAAGELREETVWLLGGSGVAAFDRLAPAAARPPRSVAFEAAGIYALHGAGTPLQQCFVDAGVQGPWTAAHGHADALSVQLAADGRMWLIDPGSFCYISPGDERNRFRGTAAHNTLQVDGMDQAEPLRPFTWGALPEVRVTRWVAGEMFDLFAGEHTGYGRLPQPVLHRRQVFGLKSKFWLVRDVAAGEGRHRLEIFWHLAPDLMPRARDEQTVVAEDPAGRGLVLVSPAGQPWSWEIQPAEWSPAYGRKEPASVVRFHSQALLPAESAVLLYPQGGTGRAGGTLTRMDGQGVLGYRYDEPLGKHYLLFGEGDGPWRLGEWAGDAEFVYYGESAEEACLILIQGSFVELAGRSLAHCTRPVERCEILQHGVERQVFCPDPAAAVASGIQPSS